MSYPPLLVSFSQLDEQLACFFFSLELFFMTNDMNSIDLRLILQAVTNKIRNKTHESKINDINILQSDILPSL